MKKLMITLKENKRTFRRAGWVEHPKPYRWRWIPVE